jgi:hypothetical protein
MAWFWRLRWRLRRDPRRFLPETTVPISEAIGRHLEAARHDRYLPEAR